MLKLFPFGSWFYCHFENLWKEGKSEKQEVFTGFPTTFTSYEIYDSKALTPPPAPPRRPPPSFYCTAFLRFSHPARSL